MARVAQPGRAPGCGPGGPGFKSRPGPHNLALNLLSDQHWAGDAVGLAQRVPPKISWFGQCRAVNRFIWLLAWLWAAPACGGVGGRGMQENRG